VILTVSTPYDLHQYAGAFTVTSSAIDWITPGRIVEFARYSGVDVRIQDTETTDRMGVPATSLALETLGSDRWRISKDGSFLLEIAPTPSDYRPRQFGPPTTYRLMKRRFPRLMPWPDPPKSVSLAELLAGSSRG
jgi:hypothetical protein